MIRRFGMAALLAATIGAVAPLAQMGVAAAQHTQAAKALYKANWTKGKNHWSLGPGFSVKKGKLVFNGSDQSGSQPALAPFTKSVTNFAVVTTLTLGQAKNTNDSNVGLLIRGTQNAGLDLIYRHTANDAFAGGTYDAPEIDYYTSSVAGFVPGDVATPLAAGKHTFRAEVEGNNYRLLIDGKQVVPWTALSEADPQGVEGITGSGVPFTVSSFQIQSLKASQVTAVNTPDVLGAKALTVTDVGVPNDGRFFADPWWVAHLDQTTVDTITAAGLVESLAQNLFSNDTNVWQYIDQFNSAAAATAHLQGEQQFYADPKNQPTGSQVLDTSSLGIGESSFGFTRQFQSTGGPTVYEEVVWFQRGSYLSEIDVMSLTQSTLAQQALAIFHAADQHLQS